MSGFQGLLLIAVVVSATAAVFDFKTGLIPNQITYPLTLVGAIVHFSLSVYVLHGASVGWVLLETLAGALLCGVVPLLLWRSQAMGGGDVKLLTGLGAMLGPALGLQVELYAFLTAVAAAPILLAYRGVLLVTLKRSFGLLLRPFRRSKDSAAADTPLTELRFGPAICAATALVAVLEWR
jgi:prepilin peptidase CpaA